MTSRRLLPLALLFVVLAACGKDSKGGGPPPAEPYTGAPVAFEVVKVRPPEALDVKVYNFSEDKTFATYSLLIRYYDKDGKVIMVKPGTSFEKDHDFWSISGRGFIAKPKTWTSMELDHLEIPEGTVKAEVLARSVTAVKADGMTMEENDHWSLEDGMKWPEPPAAK